MGNQFEGENWRDWFNQWGDRFLLFARQQARHLDEAEDIVQDAMVHIWTRRHQFARIEPGLVFLQIRRNAINKARTEMRRQRREKAFATERVPLFERPPHHGLGGDLEAALDKLSLDQREVIVLKIWGEQTFESIGMALEISPNTAASRYRYGLENLKRLLKGESDGL